MNQTDNHYLSLEPEAPISDFYSDAMTTQFSVHALSSSQTYPGTGPSPSNDYIASTAANHAYSYYNTSSATPSTPNLAPSANIDPPEPETQVTSPVVQDQRGRRKRKKKTKRQQAAAGGEDYGAPGGGAACPRGGTANVSAARDAAAQVEADAIAWDQEVEESVRRRRQREAREAARLVEAQYEDELNTVGAEVEGLPVGTWVKQVTRNKQTLRPTGATIMNSLTTIKVEELASYMEKFLSGDSWKDAVELFQVNTLVAIADRCKKVEEAQKAYSFVSIINYINFVFKAEAYVFRYYSSEICCLIINCLVFVDSEDFKLQWKP